MTSNPSIVGDTSPHDRPALATVPVGLRVDGRPVLVVGGGPIAARKAKNFVDQGALVHIVAPKVSQEMSQLNYASLSRRRFRASDVVSMWWVTTATGRHEVDGEVFAACEARHIWCNAADDPQHCSAILPAVVRNGDITITIATGGTSPATASWLRRRIDDLIGAPEREILAIASRVRFRMRSQGLPTEVPGWGRVLDNEALDLVREGKADRLEQRLIEECTR